MSHPLRPLKILVPNFITAKATKPTTTIVAMMPAFAAMDSATLYRTVWIPVMSSVMVSVKLGGVLIFSPKIFKSSDLFIDSG